MSKIRIVTDSTADLPKELIEKYGITIVPLKIHFNDVETYLDGVDLTPGEFYEKLRNSEKPPTTSQPPPGEFVSTYENLALKGAEEIISIHLSKKFSGTYQSACLAKNLVNEKVNVEVIDSQSVSMGMGLIVLAAAKAAQEGKSFQEILALVNDLINKMTIYFIVDTLDYLEKGGRIGKASYLLGSLLSIKPILEISDGEIHVYEKARGRSKAIERLLEIAQSKIKENSKVMCSLVHCDALPELMKLSNKVTEILNCEDLIISDMGGVIGTHVGPGTIGLIFYEI